LPVTAEANWREGNCASRQQVFSQFPKLSRHFRQAIFFSTATVTPQQLKFCAAEIARAQVDFDLSAICNRQAMTMVTQQSLRGRTTRRFAKSIRW